MDHPQIDDPLSTIGCHEGGEVPIRAEERKHLPPLIQLCVRGEPTA
jgi:hypothetical protein